MKKPLIALFFVFVILSSIALGYGVYITTNVNLNDPLVYLSLGDFLYGKNLRQHAVAAYEKGLFLDAGNAKILNNLGVAHLEDDQALSEELFLKALLAEPEYEIARKNLALLYNSQKKYTEAAEEFAKLVESCPNNVRYNYDYAINLGEKYYYETKSLSDLDTAITYFEKAESLSPGFDNAVENLNVLREIRSLYN